MEELKGKKVLVTGSSRGIGAAIALDLAKCGATVYVHYVNREDKALEIVQKIKELGSDAYTIQADLSDKNGTDGLIEKIGGADILVLNASQQIPEDWDKISKEHFYSQINCNLLSSMLLIQQAYPYMAKNKWGRIITIGSVQEAKPHPQMLVYSASKCAQTAMVKSLALQMADDNITVNNIAPGAIFTDRNLGVLEDKEYYNSVLDLIPLHKFGNPEDICGTVRLLCSNEGSYITGQSIYIDGGKSVK